MDRLEEAFRNLREVHRRLQSEFIQLHQSIIDEYLEEYSEVLSSQLREYGDGYTCHSIPRSIVEPNTTDAIVVVAVTSPKLNKDSDFDPTTPLHTIPYWRDTKGLRPEATSKVSDRKYRLHFMSWQQNCSVHGRDDHHARKNRRLLINSRSQFNQLLDTEKRAAIEFVHHLSDWFRQKGKILVPLTGPTSARLSEPMEQLVRVWEKHHVRAQLRGRNYQIMPRIEEILP